MHMKQWRHIVHMQCVLSRIMWLPTDAHGIPGESHLLSGKCPPESTSLLLSEVKWNVLLPLQGCPHCFPLVVADDSENTSNRFADSLAVHQYAISC